MRKKLLAALMSLLAAAAVAAVDVNQATRAELEAVKGIGPDVAGRILEERKQGAFIDWADLVNRVKGVGAASAARFSAAGLTVSGMAYAGSVAATPAAPK